MEYSHSKGTLVVLFYDTVLDLFVPFTELFAFSLFTLGYRLDITVSYKVICKKSVVQIYRHWKANSSDIFIIILIKKQQMNGAMSFL